MKSACQALVMAAPVVRLTTYLSASRLAGVPRYLDILTARSQFFASRPSLE
eukprot:CAMPEP_0204072270 /NCGR_PEP_ID=MMETSP0360-20130528/161445_1 /ASSEMBLY_ACC=CAM_ASM_000342 /TAXON_ID=268821 /ORGANISM="Scrippsiella Hangoei, Strain SHTV-5" /LENGTH=50 /DNA_ID=CAMNT_0051020595 /DNA_START=29 /DNA_END=181 /DNA_ORIENTATION=-